MTPRPPTMAEAAKRGLLAEYGEGIKTFSNGTEWDLWADANCYECWYWNADTMGAACAFEAATFLYLASPELARMFGWVRDTPTAEKYGERFAYDPPQQCAFFRSRTDSDGNDNPPPPDPDPTQLVLIADPTEDAALVTRSAPVDVEVGV